MEYNGSCFQSGASSELFVDGSYSEDLMEKEDEKEGEVGKKESEEENQTQSVVYVSSDPIYYDTGQMVEISCAGLAIGCGIAFFASIVGLGIRYVKNTFSCLTGTGEEV